MVDVEQAAAQIAADVKAIDQNMDKLIADNRRMKTLLSQVALFVAMQPENRFRAKWLAEVDGILNG